MAEIKLIGALDGMGTNVPDGDGLRIKVVPQQAQINLRGNAVELAPRLSQGTPSFPLADAPNRSASEDGWTSLGLGPDEWLLVGPFERLHEALAGLQQSLADIHASIVDVSSNRVVLDVSGRDVGDTVSALSPFDLSELGAGACVQTLMAKAQVILQCFEPMAFYRIYVRSSFARYLRDVIVDAAAVSGPSHRNFP